MCKDKGEKKMAVPHSAIESEKKEAERKEKIKAASKAINKKYDKALRMISKN